MRKLTSCSICVWVFFFCSYNKLFRFLLKVKRTQLDLQQVWAAYMGTKHLSTAQLSNMTKIWLSRMHMAFLVDNLQYYLQVTYLQLKILIKRNSGICIAHMNESTYQQTYYVFVEGR